MSISLKPGTMGIKYLQPRNFAKWQKNIFNLFVLLRSRDCMKTRFLRAIIPAKAGILTEFQGLNIHIH